MAAEPAPDRPKRLSLSQILELILTRPSSASSVTIGRNASGNTTLEVHVVAADPAHVDAAGEHAEQLYDQLAQKYALEPDAGETAAVTLSRNAKGETQIEVVARGDRAPEHVSGSAVVEYDRLRTAYPMSSGFVGAQPPAKAE